ncbi:MAG: hypothetical protein IJC17_00190 [Clostridia bacterium]|nr:hypothetical protein [Clostridia bacterium]
MGKIQRAVALSVAFLLALTLCAWAVVGSLLTTVYSPKFVERYVEGAYTDAAYDALMDNWSNFGEPALIPQSVFEKALPRAQFAEYLRQYMLNLWETGAYSTRTDAEEVKVSLMAAFTAYAAEVNTPMTQALEDALSTLRNSCVEAYHTHTNVPGIDSVFLAMLTTKKPVAIVFWILSALLVLLGLTVFRFKRYWGGGLRETSYGVFSATLLLAGAALWLLTTNPFAAANLNPPHLRLPLMAIAGDLAWQWLAVAAATLLIGATLVWLAERPHAKRSARRVRKNFGNS